MGLDELDWRPVCCSDHLTATVDLGDGLALNVQQSAGVYGVTYTKNGLFVSAERSISQDRAQEIVSLL